MLMYLTFMQYCHEKSAMQINAAYLTGKNIHSHQITQRYSGDRFQRLPFKFIKHHFSEGRRRKTSVNQTIYLFHMIGVLRCTQEYFTYTTAASIMMRGNRAMPAGNPRPYAGCWQTVPLTSEEKVRINSQHCTGE